MGGVRYLRGVRVRGRDKVVSERVRVLGRGIGAHKEQTVTFS